MKLIIVSLTIILFWFVKIFPQFGSQDSGGPLTPDWAAYDIKFYNINLNINPDKQTINGWVGVTADAYGEYDENAIQKVKRNLFPEEAELETGLTYFAHSPEGQHLQFVITEIENDDITVNFNHPLAGKNLEFDVHLLDVRDATPEEISHGHVHGPGGHHHH